MNSLQEHIVVSKALPEPVWFFLHQPIVALERPDTASLYSHFMAWTLGLVGYAGWKLQPWGIPKDLFKNVRRQMFCFVGDALRVNDSLFKFLAQAVCNQTFGDRDPACFVMQVYCQIHQLALTRKVIALGFPGYWTNLVRLGHLFESHAFRQKLKWPFHR